MHKKNEVSDYYRHEILHLFLKKDLWGKMIESNDETINVPVNRKMAELT